MTIFVDASALVAIIASEPERAALLTRLDDDSKRLSSPMAIWETVSALQNSYEAGVDEARQEVGDAAQLLGLQLVAIGEAELQVALDAYKRYGKGRHPARLNFGDCFAYACAKTNGATLLYKGDDFARTDLA